MGRLVLNGGALKDNIFMSSELACAGRPMDFNNVTLPRQRDLLLPEPLDVDSGILLGKDPKGPFDPPVSGSVPVEARQGVIPWPVADCQSDPLCGGCRKRSA